MFINPFLKSKLYYDNLRKHHHLDFFLSTCTCVYSWNRQYSFPFEIYSNQSFLDICCCEFFKHRSDSCFDRAYVLVNNYDYLIFYVSVSLLISIMNKFKWFFSPLIVFILSTGIAYILVNHNLKMYIGVGTHSISKSPSFMLFTVLTVIIKEKCLFSGINWLYFNLLMWN